MQEANLPSEAATNKALGPESTATPNEASAVFTVHKPPSRIRAAGLTTVAVFTALIIGYVFARLTCRPASETAWNESAVTATFDSMDLNDHVVTFTYIVANNSQKDFVLREFDESRLLARMRKQHTLLNVGDAAK